MARSELLRLLTACKQEPEDNHTRLVLADWLEEHGDESDQARADLIRLQLRGPDQPDLAALCEQRWREWTTRWTPFAHHGEARPERGLVGLECRRSGEWAGSEAWEWVERLHTPNAVLSALAEAGLLDSIGRLDLTYQEVGDMRSLARCRAAWSELRLTHCRITEEGLPSLLSLPATQSVRVLGLESSVSPAEIRALGQPETLPHLDEVRLNGEPGLDDLFALMLQTTRKRFRALTVGTDLASVWGGTLAGSDSCAGLRRLSLTHGRWTADYRVLASARFWASLEELMVVGQSFNEWRADSLARADASALRRLTFHGGGFERGTLATLARSRLMGTLDSLELDNVRLPVDELAGLTEMPTAPLCLRVRSCHLGNDGAALARWPGLARCRVLDLSNNGIGDDGLKALAASPHAANLRGLILDGNGISDAGLERLLSADWIGRLEQLHLKGNGLSTRCRPLASASLPAMRELLVGKQSLAARLRAALPHIECIA